MRSKQLILFGIHVIFLAAALPAADRSIVKLAPLTKSECSYAQVGGSLESHGDCLELLGNGRFKVRPKHLKKMDFSYAKGLAALYFQGGTAYVSKKGKVARTFTYDNGPDYFVEGLARGIGQNGKMGFINHDLDFVIPPKFDYVTPFDEGKAEYCNGCYPESLGEEHSKVTGGEKGWIDKKGHELKVPLQKNNEP